jgi:hypothetical protein
MAREALAKVEALAARLEEKLGDNLVAFCMYGPAVRRDTRDADREVTTLLIVHDAAPAKLRPIEQPIADWSRKGHPPPLVFAESGWRASADVFPFLSLTTTREDLRRQLEREARGKLLRLRTEFVAAAPKGKALEDLLLDSIGTFFVLFRAALRLVGEAPPQTPKALVQETAAVAGLDGTAFDWVVDKLVGHNVPSLRAYDPVGDHYVEQIEQLVRFIDAFETEGAGQAPEQESQG